MRPTDKLAVCVVFGALLRDLRHALAEDIKLEPWRGSLAGHLDAGEELLGQLERQRLDELREKIAAEAEDFEDARRERERETYAADESRQTRNRRNGGCRCQ